MDESRSIQALTFDLFGTVLDLGTSLQRPIAALLAGHSPVVSSDRFWEDWRGRQRIEQYQDTIMMLGHGGYLETVRRALLYTLRKHDIDAPNEEVQLLMKAWRNLSPFPDVLQALQRLQPQYRLVVLSNGDPEYLSHLVTARLEWEFDYVFSVSTVGVFKPHPAVYRRAVRELGLEPWQCLMVSANSFDVIGARACGLRGAYVNRYALPCEESAYVPDLEVADFRELADSLV